MKGTKNEKIWYRVFQEEGAASAKALRLSCAKHVQMAWSPVWLEWTEQGEKSKRGCWRAL